MERLRSVADYLSSIPGGVAAYPECVHKGEPLRVWLERSPTEGLADLVPPEVAALLEPGARVPTWVSEVHAAVIYLAMREVHFADDAAFLEHARHCNRAVLETPLNRVLFWAASPRAILRGGALRWTALHGGSWAEVRTPDDHSAEVTLNFPPRLLPEVVVRGNGVGMAMALEYAGAREVEVSLRSLSVTRALFDARWR
jgi:hypothetical protein